MSTTETTRTQHSTLSTQHSRIADTFARAKAENRAALMPFVTVGWPKLGDTERLVPALIEGGGDMIELGFPFSDPIADGPTIQQTNQQALANGVTPAYALEVAGKLRANGVEAPLLFMGYYNPIFSYGLQAFAAACAGAGIDGLIIPDLPPEESDPLLDACREHGLNLIYLIAPTSTAERVDAVIERANGFIYIVSLTGVTGARSQLATNLADYIARVRGKTDLPLAIGFGISTREHVEQVEPLVDGVICASALLNRLNGVASEELPRVAREFVEGLRGT
ncbi:MAG TPA: tryptophan synthase subunit alpha [Thermomicrobiales bacterium]|nr:tryptophan synthase subunit alpha [Thermomicrobiales bacterium]